MKDSVQTVHGHARDHRIARPATLSPPTGMADQYSSGKLPASTASLFSRQGITAEACRTHSAPHTTSPGNAITNWPPGTGSAPSNRQTH